MDLLFPLPKIAPETPLETPEQEAAHMRRVTTATMTQIIRRIGGIPDTYERLTQDKDAAKVITRTANRAKRDHADVLQELRCLLQQRAVLEGFGRLLADQLTTEVSELEMCQIWGVLPSEVTAARRSGERICTPTTMSEAEAMERPGEARYSLTAVVQQVLRVQSFFPDWGRDIDERGEYRYATCVEPPRFRFPTRLHLSKDDFLGYLSRTLANHFANICRTNARHFNSEVPTDLERGGSAPPPFSADDPFERVATEEAWRDILLTLAVYSLDADDLTRLTDELYAHRATLRSAIGRLQWPTPVYRALMRLRWRHAA